MEEKTVSGIWAPAEQDLQGYCPHCGADVTDWCNKNYCGQCGKEINWEE